MEICAQIIVCVFMYTYIIYIYIYIYICMCVSMYAYLFARKSCMQTYIFTCIHAGRYKNIYEQTLVYRSVKPTAGDCALCVPSYVDM